MGRRKLPSVGAAHQSPARLTATGVAVLVDPHQVPKGPPGATLYAPELAVLQLTAVRGFPRPIVWHSAVIDPSVADAVLDRLVHGAHKIAMRGDSMRKVLKNGH